MRSNWMKMVPVVFATTAAAAPLETVDVIGHYEAAIGTTDAASAGSVTSRLLENRPALRPGEVLEFVPGVIVTQHSGDGKANQYFLRGFNLDHGTDFQTRVGGMPANMRTHAHGQGYTDPNFLIPELIERIDYKKGPYYAELGDFASAGAAQMQWFNQLPRGIASLTLGGNDYARALLADSVSDERGTLLYGVDLTYNNGPWGEPEGFHRHSGLLRFSNGDHGNGYDNGFAITAMAYSARWTATDQIPERAVASGLIDRFDSLNPTDGGESHRYSLSLEGNRSDSEGRSAINAYAIKSDLSLFSDFTYQLDHPGDLGDAIGGDQFEQHEKRQVFGFDVSHTFLGKIVGHENEATLGIESRYDKLDPVALYSTVARQRAMVTREDEVKEFSAGVYLSNHTHWTDWLRTTAGLRFDKYDFNVDSNIEENSGDADDSITSPKLSVVLGPWAQTEYFLNYGEGFHSNDARGTTQRLAVGSGDPIEPVTPLVKSRGSEIGARTEIIPGLQSSLAIWQLKLDSELVFVGDAGDTEATRASKRYGVEWSNHYIASRHWLVDLDLSWSHARFYGNKGQGDDPAGDHIPGAVEQVASFGVSLVDLGPWFAQLQMRYFGPRPLLEDDSQRSDSTVLTYLRGGYRIDPNWKVALDIFNLFDREVSDIDYFYTSRLTGEDAAGVDDRHFHPVEPRTMRASVTYNF